MRRKMATGRAARTPKEPSNQEPKPCPWCGKKPKAKRRPLLDGSDKWFIECTNRRCRVRPVTDEMADNRLALLAWNTRKA